MITHRTQSRLIGWGFSMAYLGLMGLMVASSTDKLGESALRISRLVLLLIVSVGAVLLAMGHFLPVRPQSD